MYYATIKKVLPEKLYLWSLFVQFRLHSVMLNYNYFVCNSVDKLNGMGSSFFFKKVNVCEGGLSSVNMYGEGRWGSPKKDNFMWM